MRDILGRNLPLAALILALAPLAVALAAQYLAGLAPCPLCHWQRYPYIVAALLAAAALATRAAERQRFLVLLAALAILASAGIGAFHAGVEWKWWEGTAGCSGSIDFSGMTVEEMQQALGETAPVRCDEPAWTMFGISMAGYNFLYGTAAAIVLIVGALGTHRREPA